MVRSGLVLEVFCSLSHQDFLMGATLGCKTERIVKNDRNVLNLSNCKKGAATDQDGGGESGSWLGGQQELDVVCQVGE